MASTAHAHDDVFLNCRLQLRRPTVVRPTDLELSAAFGGVNSNDTPIGAENVRS